MSGKSSVRVFEVSCSLAGLVVALSATMLVNPVALAGPNPHPIEVVGEDAVLELQPDPESPRLLVESWRVTRDNPRVGGQFRMPFGNDVLPGFQRIDHLAWLYDFFDLEVAFEDEGPTRRRPSWPQEVGFGSVDFVPELAWESHGLLLDPLGSAAKVQLWEDDWQNPDVTWVDSYFHLDPDVRVVPVTTVVLHGPGLEQHPALSANRITAEDTQLLFDDDWLAEKSIHSAPGYSPEQVITAWSHRPACAAGVGSCQGQVVADPDRPTLPGRSLQPDPIFHRCGVQFRQVGHYTCGVPADVLYRQQGTACDGTGAAGAIDFELRENCPHIPLHDGSKIVVFTGRLHHDTCAGDLFGLKPVGSDYVLIADHARRNVVAHELAHSIGVDKHVSGDCSAPSGNLMCEGGHHQLFELTGEQCGEAWGGADLAHQLYW